MVLGGVIQPLGGDDLLNDLTLDHFAQVFLIDLWVMLGRENDGIDTAGLAFGVIAEGNLALGIRAQPRQQAIFTQFGLTLDQPMRVVDRRGHKRVGFVSCVAKHQALVASTLIFRLAAVNALGDIDTLLANQVNHAAGRAVKADIRRVIANADNHIAHQGF